MSTLGVSSTSAPGPNDTPWDPLAQAYAETGAPLQGCWHHLVYSYDGAVQSVYVDGALANSKTLSFTVATNAGIALGAQWLTTGISTTPAHAKLALARVRIHDGALTAAQARNNYNTEKSGFNVASPALLTAGPVHRYSFNEPAANDANGLAFADSVGGANGLAQGVAGFQPAQFSGRRLVLPGGFGGNGTPTGPYGDLPNGMVSANSTNNGGSGELSIEIWYKLVSPNLSLARVFDFGSLKGVEVTGPGGFPSGSAGSDYFYFAAGATSVNGRRLAWSNLDPGPTGTADPTAVSADEVTMGAFQNDRHLVVTWKESTGRILAYENGQLAASLWASNSMSALNDLNLWLGRANGTDVGFAGE